MTRWSPLSEWPREGELICIHDGRLIALAIRRGPWLEVQSPEMRVRLAEHPDWTWTEAPEPPKHSSNPVKRKIADSQFRNSWEIESSVSISY